MTLKSTKFKLILGLGNKDIKSAIDTALLYAKAGVRFFDFAPEIIPEILNSFKGAGFNLEDFTICASVPTLGDIHGRKAVISDTICSSCGICRPLCPEGAIIIDNKTKKSKIDSKKCIGCGICKKTTNCYAISFEYGNQELQSLKNLVNAGVSLDMAELHASVSNKKQIVNDFKEILSFFKKDISVCLNRKQFPLDESVALLKELNRIYKNVNPDGNFFVQADGASMNGGAQDENSTLECILFAKELSPHGFNLIISGGTNLNTPLALKNAGISPIVAYGTFARKLISGLSKEEALTKAKELVEITENSTSFGVLL